MDIELLRDMAKISYSGITNENYEPRDNIERSVSELLPFKNVIDVQNSSNSNIKVELFHGSVTEEQLSKMEKVLNKAVEICEQYGFTPCSTDLKIRAFCFDDRDQYINAIKDVGCRDCSTTTGLTKGNEISDNPNLSDVNMYFYQNYKPRNLAENTYFVLVHELFHNLVHRSVCGINGFDYFPLVEEGFASVLAWKSLNDLGYYNQELDVREGAIIIKAKGLSFFDLIYARKIITDKDGWSDKREGAIIVEEKESDFSNVMDSKKIIFVKDVHRIAEALGSFIGSSNPEMIKNTFSCYLKDFNSSDDNICQEFFRKAFYINQSAEFPCWIADQIGYQCEVGRDIIV